MNKQAFGFILLFLFVLISAVVLADKASNAPETIVLKKLENLWQPVNFDHSMHVDVAENCTTCHHKPVGKNLACSECHKIPFDEKNLKVIGLKGALHQQCMGCHKENKMDNSCDFCHKRK